MTGPSPWRMGSAAALLLLPAGGAARATPDTGAHSLLDLSRPVVEQVDDGGATEESATAGQVRRPEEFGAVGDGVADDGAAVQRALDALAPGQALVLGARRVYRHNGVLLIRRAGARLTGSGALLAGNEARSSLQVQAPDVHVDGVRLGITRTTHRWTAMDQHRLVLGAYSGIVVERVQVAGSAGAGVFVDGARNFRLDDLLVSNTRADGIHITNGAQDGLVRRPTVRSSGDDGVAVVSYQGDRSATRHITVVSPTVLRTTWGRGISVVGGEDITYRDVRVEDSNAAAVYIATEGAPFFTRSARRVQVLGGVLVRSNSNAAVDHGAVLVSSANAGNEVEQVLVQDVTIRQTRRSASRQVGVLVQRGFLNRVELLRIDISGGGHIFHADRATGWRAAGWVVDGRPVRDVRNP